NHIAEASEQAGALRTLAMQQGDLFGILSNTNQVESEVRFIALLLKIQRHKGASHEVRKGRAHNGVDQRCPKQIARDVEFKSKRMQWRRGRKVPEDHGKREKCDDRI